MTWTSFQAASSQLMLARSTDGGATWHAPQRMSGNANLFTIGNQIVVLPDGTLIDFTDYSTGSGVQPANHDWKAVFRSTDLEIPAPGAKTSQRPMCTTAVGCLTTNGVAVADTGKRMV